MFHGSMVALITPLTANNEIDWQAFERLIAMHIEAKTNALIIAGTTGESATLTAAERLLLLERAIKYAAGRIAIIAGTGTNCTVRTIELSIQAMEAGADACLLVTPYYNKPTQEGLFFHYREVAKKVPIPIVLYNVPSRTAVDLLPETAAKLAQIPNIIGIKEATAELSRLQQLQQLCGDKLDFYSGDDNNCCDFMLQGGKGVISVTANVAPTLMQQMSAAALQKNQQQAKAINEKILPLHTNLFIESNPIPVKWALYKLGFCENVLRLPLTPLSEKYYPMVTAALKHAEVL